MLGISGCGTAHLRKMLMGIFCQIMWETVKYQWSNIYYLVKWMETCLFLIALTFVRSFFECRILYCCPRWTLKSEIQNFIIQVLWHVCLCNNKPKLLPNSTLVCISYVVIVEGSVLVKRKNMCLHDQ